MKKTDSIVATDLRVNVKQETQIGRNLGAGGGFETGRCVLDTTHAMT